MQKKHEAVATATAESNGHEAGKVVDITGASAPAKTEPPKKAELTIEQKMTERLRLWTNRRAALMQQHQEQLRAVQMTEAEIHQVDGRISELSEMTQPAQA